MVCKGKDRVCFFERSGSRYTETEKERTQSTCYKPMLLYNQRVNEKAHEVQREWAVNTYLYVLGTSDRVTRDH